ncbi:6-carboxytetrahydropterin synthase QueD [Paenibacillus radicis (ex Xue et al. 2023)]|uniref:6-carboxy-5,6,7,8-tetrahydropterin synthase n=1 Tax=Paenibacillus radicis (ex Xue et al. 2023) TaxID=2972489 RepID=A0ABT1YD76_9BACL|nr:6-carboxytetrahydropterin synthase QueD [Paenibacillus radicis (ex Xue et al. 2023)]MCR8631136.1 6-carboxytetrahydropterin synthase QueD [Paenibacillus radicis (ex Xue et al. 2023)]
MEYEIPTKVQRLGVDISKDQLKYHDKEVLVSKEFTFDSAHHLHCYEGKCKSLHGHTYKLQVIMRGKVDERGISIDFGDIKRIAKERIMDLLDHRYLNDVLPLMNTTAENMVVWMYEQLDQALREESLYPKVRLEEVRLWETPTSYAAVTAAMMGDVPGGS